MTNLPLISIITLNYNQAKVTCEFLASCSEIAYPNFEIHVCDMHSKEDLADYLKKNYIAEKAGNVHFHYSNKNLGFAGGNNWGMQFAKGDYVLMLNNDVEVAPDILEKLLFVFNEYRDAGVVCPKIKYFDSKNHIQYAGFGPMNPYTGRTYTIGDKEIDTGQYDKIYPTYGAHGAAMMIKKEVIEAVGRFPEKFFLYYEEWDWSARILKAEYKIYFQGNTTVYHKESISVGKSNPMKIYYLTRNRILYMRRNSRSLQLAVFTVFFLFLAIPKTIFKYLISGNIPFLKAFLRGVRDNFLISSYSPV